MKKTATALIALSMVLAASAPTFAWGGKGHKTIGQIADLRLANTTTLTKIKNILRPGETLASIANWADTVKTESKFRVDAVHSDPDTQKFFRNLNNRRNRTWHFVDLPLHCTGYNDLQCKSFTSSNDIVHMINLSIRRLRVAMCPNLRRAMPCVCSCI